MLTSPCKELQRTMHPIRATHLNRNRSTCKEDLSSHLDCSHLSQCCFLTCKPLACPRSMQVYRYSSQKATEQPKCKDLQRPAKTCKEPCTPSDLTKRRVTSRCGSVASAFSIVLNAAHSASIMSPSTWLHEQPEGFLGKPAAGFRKARVKRH